MQLVYFGLMVARVWGTSTLPTEDKLTSGACSAGIPKVSGVVSHVLVSNSSGTPRLEPKTERERCGWSQ